MYNQSISNKNKNHDSFLLQRFQLTQPDAVWDFQAMKNFLWNIYELRVYTM